MSLKILVSFQYTQIGGGFGFGDATVSIPDGRLTGDVIDHIRGTLKKAEYESLIILNITKLDA